MAEDNNYYTISALGKAFSIIEFMAHKAQWELRKLAQASSPKGTLQRILLTLCELGYVTQKSRGDTYGLTLKFFKLRHRIAANNNLVEQGHASCHQLMGSVNETVNLCVALNTEMVVIDQQVSWRRFQLDSVIGSSFPIYLSASGKVYCALLSELELLNLLNIIRKERPHLTSQDIDVFCTELEQVRREGIGMDYEELFAGVRCVAAPIFDYTGNIAATIGCSVPTARITKESSERLVHEVGATATQISHILGAPTHDFTPSTRSLLDCPTRAQRTPSGRIKEHICSVLS